MQRMNGETKTRRASERERQREREGRVNNLHSDESIVLRQAHATVPIMALRLVDAPTTGLRPLSLLFSFPLGEEPRHRRSYTYIYTSISIYVYLYIYIFFPPHGCSSFLLSCSFLRGYRPAAGSFSPREF